MKELIMHCNREEMPGIEERVLSLIGQLGLRVRAVASVSKQSLVWEAYTPQGVLALKYARKYDCGFYKMNCDVVQLDDLRLRKFYDGMRTL